MRHQSRGYQPSKWNKAAQMMKNIKIRMISLWYRRTCSEKRSTNERSTTEGNRGVGQRRRSQFLDKIAKPESHGKAQDRKQWKMRVLWSKFAVSNWFSRPLDDDETRHCNMRTIPSSFLFYWSTHRKREECCISCINDEL